MLKKYSQVFVSIIYFTDIIVVYLAWMLSYYIRFFSGLFPLYNEIPPFEIYVRFSIIIVIIWSVCFRAFHLYQPMRGRSQFVEFLNIVKVSTFAILIMTGVTFFYREYSYSRIVFMIFWVISSSLLMTAHFMLRKGLAEMRRRGLNLRHVIIVGDGELGQTLAARVKLHPEIGFKIIGYVSDRAETAGKSITGIPVIGHTDNLVDIIHTHTPDQLLLALPMESYGKLDAILSALRDETVDIKIIPDLLRFIKINPGIEDFDGLPVINISESPLYGWNKLIKRGLDIVLSTLAVVLLSPLLLLIAFLVKAGSHGPILFRQVRMGMDGKEFTIFKFRTMAVDAESKSGPVWARKNDNRRTFSGRFLRATSLDELPQLLNVLKGEMSLVGPRPERPVFVREFRKSIPRYMLRHKIKAGITGWAQINGYRGNTSITGRIEHDLYYIENWSIWFDIKIMLLTIFKGFISPHAY